MDDNSKMPWGLHKGKAMVNVPAEYLVWLYDNNKCSSDVRKYIKDNLDVLKSEIKNKERK